MPWFLSGLRSLLSKLRVPDGQFMLHLGDNLVLFFIQMYHKVLAKHILLIFRMLFHRTATVTKTTA